MSRSTSPCKSPFEDCGDVFSVVLDMNQFQSSELSVKVLDNSVVVIEARHEERDDKDYGSVSRHFIHRYRLPNNVDPLSVASDLSDRGILTITARKTPEIGTKELIVPIKKKS